MKPPKQQEPISSSDYFSEFTQTPTQGSQTRVLEAHRDFAP